jgi:Ca-activated chloride channel family protein
MIFLEGGGFEFFWIWAAWFWPLPFLLRLLPPREYSVQALRVPFFQRIADLPQASFSQKIFTKSLILAAFVWSLIVLASMRPQWVGDAVELPLSGRSVMLAVDLSGSMKEKDMELQGSAVTRLEIVKSVLRPFIDRRKGDRLGLILFGDQAYLQTPLTFDRETLGQMLEESELGLAGQRTAIGNAIGLAVKRMKDLPDSQKVLILLTDGQNTAGEVSPEVAGQLAKQTGVRIHTIGVGADEAWLRTFLGTQKINPSAELDEVMLQSLASLTGGSYYRARSTEELEKIYAMIDVIEPVEREKEVFRPRQALFFWPLGFAVLIIGIWVGVLMYRK